MTEQSKNLLTGFGLMLIGLVACLSLTIQAAPTLDRPSIEQGQK